MLESKLAELERLSEEAQSGPWRAHGCYVEYVGMMATTEDADFIVAARTALPVLLAEVRALTEIVEAAKEIQRADPYHRAENINGTTMCDAMDGLYKLLDARDEADRG